MMKIAGEQFAEAYVESDSQHGNGDFNMQEEGKTQDSTFTCP